MLEGLPFLLLEFDPLFGAQLLFGQVLPCPLQEKLDKEVYPVPSTDKTGLRPLLARTTNFHHFFAAVL